MRDRVSVELVNDAIDLSALQQRIGDPDVGAHGWFVGVTRRTTTNEDSGDSVTKSLSYQAHESMAVSELKDLAFHAVRKFGLTKIVIVHRLGDVPIGQASVVVGCSSPHRGPTFQALPWVMEVLKRDVPIWKRETFADESMQWVHPNTNPDGGRPR